MEAHLLKRSEKLELLERYTLYLQKHGYIDTDWNCEEPNTIDDFMKGEDKLTK